MKFEMVIFTRPRFTKNANDGGNFLDNRRGAGLSDSRVLLLKYILLVNLPLSGKKFSVWVTLKQGFGIINMFELQINPA